MSFLNLLFMYISDDINTGVITVMGDLPCRGGELFVLHLLCDLANESSSDLLRTVKGLSNSRLLDN